MTGGCLPGPDDWRNFYQAPNDWRMLSKLTRPQRTPASARLELSSSRTLHGRFTSLLVTLIIMMMVMTVVLETTYQVIEASIDER